MSKLKLEINMIVLLKIFKKILDYNREQIENNIKAKFHLYY